MEALHLKKNFFISSAFSKNGCECAFGRLKGWFGILRKDIDTDLKTTLNIIYACFVLHNFCEMNKEQLLDDIVSTAIHNNNNMQPPTQNY